MANDQIIVGGGGPTGRIGEPVPPAASPVGFKDASGNLANASLDGSGNLKVSVTGAGSGGTSSVDESTFTPGVSAGTPAMGVYEVTPTALTDGQLGIVELDENRNLCVNVKAGGAGGGAVTIADGADVTEGSTTDVAVTGDNDGTVSAKLRGVDKILADVWDSVNHWLKVSIQNATLAVTQSGSWTVTAAQSTFSSLKATITGNGTAGTADAGVVTVQGIASMTPVQVSQATAASLNATVVGAGSAGTANAGVVTVQGIASMTKLLVTPDANSSVNVAQLAGTTTDTNSGNKSAGTLRVVVATDQPALTNPQPVKYTFKAAYGTSNQTITITIASLGSGSSQSSAAVDNTSNLFLDALVQIKIKSAGSSTSSTGFVNVYAYGSSDGGTSYPEGAGTNTSVTLTAPPNVRLIGFLNVVANSTTYISEPFSVAAAFGGSLPAFWGIILQNNSGATLDATAGNHFAIYQGVQAQGA